MGRQVLLNGGSLSFCLSDSFQIHIPCRHGTKRPSLSSIQEVEAIDVRSIYPAKSVDVSIVHDIPLVFSAKLTLP